MILFDKIGFKRWLTTQNTGTVGIPSQSCNCPVANYIKYKHPSLKNKIHVSEAFTIIDHKQYNPPEWIREFIRKIDRKKSEISGKVALKILESVC